MKSFLTIMMLFGMQLGVCAQKYIIPLTTGITQFRLENFSGALDIKGIDGNEITITLAGGGKEKIRYRGNNGDTGMGFSIEQTKNQVLLRANGTERAYLEIKLPKTILLYIKNNRPGDGGVSLKNLQNEVEINICGSILAKDMQGPLVLATTDGAIRLDETDVTKIPAISAVSRGGMIELWLPTRGIYRLDASTISGRLFSGVGQPAGEKLTSITKGSSGPQIHLQSLSGDIHLRKK